MASLERKRKRQVSSTSNKRSSVRSKRYKKNSGRGEWCRKNNVSNGDDEDTKRSASSEEYHDDTTFSFKGVIGDVIDSRYIIRRDAGLGTFGRVLECWDDKRQRVVAIKVIRAIKKYGDAALLEVDILHDINTRDRKLSSGKNSSSLCVELLRRFKYQGHMCLVFENLGYSLYEYMKLHDYKPFPLDTIRQISYQLLVSLAFIHDMGVTHTDLKLENILFKNDKSQSVIGCSSRKFTRNLVPPACCDVRLIDFGGAVYNKESKRNSIISTRQYRAPEVMLGLRWGTMSDIWSAGCIIGELYSGELFFPTHETLEHFAMIEKCVGEFPPRMIEKAMYRSSSSSSVDVRAYFSSSSLRLRWPSRSSSSSSIKRVDKLLRLSDTFDRRDADTGLLDLMSQMLEIDPAMRITASDALKHRFFDPCRNSSAFTSTMTHQ